MSLNNAISFEKINIGEIKATVVFPQNIDHKLPTIFIYHGWSSQRAVHENLGILLACHGFMVVIPEAIHHGERGTIDYWSADSGFKYFWPTVENSIKEFKVVLDYVKANYNIDENRIGITGHSMGAITTSGIIANYKDLKAAVTMDGTGAWKEFTLELLGSDFDSLSKELQEILTRLHAISPISNIEKFKNLPLLLLHGEKDTVVPIASDNHFFEALKNAYDKGSPLKMITFDRLNHFVTQGYINEMINWFENYL